MIADEQIAISDVRGSADYRLQLAENIMAKFWYEAFGQTIESLPLFTDAPAEST